MNLLEAEGRAARRAIFRLVAALLMLVGVLALVLTAGAFFLTALYLLLRDVVTPAAAFAILGGGLLLVALLGMAVAAHLRDKKASQQ